jgi:hypothetical protein
LSTQHRIINGGRPCLLTGQTAPTSKVTIYGWSTRQPDPASHGAARDENGDSIIERDPLSPWERGSGDLF